MTEPNTADDSTDNVEVPDYLNPEELTLSIKSPLLDLTLTEKKLESDPAINIEPVTMENAVTIHLPFFLQAVEPFADDLAFSENHVHTKLDKETAKELLEQLEHAIETID